jgi:hypothetical protein
VHFIRKGTNSCLREHGHLRRRLILLAATGTFAVMFCKVSGFRLFFTYFQVKMPNSFFFTSRNISALSPNCFPHNMTCPAGRRLGHIDWDMWRLSVVLRPQHTFESGDVLFISPCGQVIMPRVDCATNRGLLCVLFSTHYRSSVQISKSDVGPDRAFAPKEYKGILRTDLSAGGILHTDCQRVWAQQ